MSSQRLRLVVYLFVQLVFVSIDAIKKKSCSTNQDCQEKIADIQDTGPGTSCVIRECESTPAGSTLAFDVSEFRKRFDKRCRETDAASMRDCTLEILKNAKVSYMDKNVCGMPFFECEGYKPCPPGFKCPEVNTWPPIPCEIGSYSLANATKCLECQAGSYADLVRKTACHVCKAGRFSSTDGQSSCQACASGSYANTTAAIACTKAKVGYFSDDGIHENACAAGTFQSAAGQSACQDCPKGSYSSSRGVSQCSRCDDGNFADVGGQTECDVCPPGSYQDESNHGCEKCSPGKFQTKSGSKRCVDCAQGYYASADGMTECAQCEPGKYQDAEKTTLCKNCSLGTFSDNYAATLCTEAKAGYFSDDRIHENACAAGTFQSAVGESQCQLCGGDHPCSLGEEKGFGCFSASEGSRACDCVSAGHAPNIASTQAVPCPAGTHQKLPCQAACQSCEPGKFATHPGSFECECNIVGHYVKDGNTSIENCSAGTYQDEDCSSNSCKQCPAGKWSHTGAGQCICAPKGAQPTDQQDGYESCAPGFYAQAECTNMCVCAPRGHVASSDRSRTIACEPGTYADQPCLASCKDCEPGKFSANSSAESCTCASKGYTSDAGRTKQVECGLGLYAAEDCAESCDKCPKGRYSNNSTAIECESCIEGYAQNQEGSSACDPCGEGSYSDEAASAECKPCSIAYGAGPHSHCIDCYSSETYFGFMYPDRCVVGPSILAAVLLCLILTCIWRCGTCRRLCCRRQAILPAQRRSAQEPLCTGARESEMSNIVVEMSNNQDDDDVSDSAAVLPAEVLEQDQPTFNPPSFASSTPSTPVSSKEPMQFGIVGSSIRLSNAACTAERVSGVAYGMCLSYEPLVQMRRGYYYEVFIDARVAARLSIRESLRAPAFGFATQRKWSLSTDGTIRVPDAKQLRRVWVAGYDSGCAEFYSDGETSKIAETAWRPLKQLEEGSIVGVLWVTKDPQELVIFQDGVEKVRLKPTGKLPTAGEEIYALVDLLGCVSKATLLQATPPRL